MTNAFYQSAEPKKKCNTCGGVFEYSMLVPCSTSSDGVRPLCKPCRVIKNKKERRIRIEKAKLLIKSQSEIRKEVPNLVKPRTFNHLKDGECWTGHTERQYIRNEGLKHIPSKGV